MRSNIYRPRHLTNADPLYRTSIEPIDRSGRVKMLTLETVYLVQCEKEWCTVADLYRELVDMAASPFESRRRGVSMRLLRYERQGLLIRYKITGRLTKYKLSQKGEDRLIFLWKKFGLLTPPPEWQSMGEEGKIGKELADARSSLSSGILENQMERLLKNRPLRAPRVRSERIYLNFQSVQDRQSRPKLRLRRRTT